MEPIAWLVATRRSRRENESALPRAPIREDRRRWPRRRS